MGEHKVFLTRLCSLHARPKRTLCPVRYFPSDYIILTSSVGRGPGRDCKALCVGPSHSHSFRVQVRIPALGSNARSSKRIGLARCSGVAKAQHWSTLARRFWLNYSRSTGPLLATNRARARARPAGCRRHRRRTPRRRTCSTSQTSRATSMPSTTGESLALYFSRAAAC